MIDPTAVHDAHCCQGEYTGVCKYGDDDCPTLAQQPIGIPPDAHKVIDDVLATLARHSKSALDDRAQAINLIMALVREVQLATSVVTALRARP